MIVPKSEYKDKTERPTKPAIPTIGPAIIKARAESVLEEDEVLTTSLESGKLLMAKDLKECISFRALMEADGHHLQSSGNYIKCCCPFHPGQHTQLLHP